MPHALTTLHDLLSQWGHIPIIALLGWIAMALHRHGVKMTFDIRIWRNGKTYSESPRDSEK